MANRSGRPRAAAPSVEAAARHPSARPGDRSDRRPPRSSVTDDAWARYVQSVTPLPGKSPPFLAEPPPAATPRPMIDEATRATAHARRAARELVVGHQPAGTDSATWRKLRGGRLGVGRTLDLHGTRVQDAFERFVAFVATASLDGVRCVDVITGLGSAEGGGIIRRELPMWLNLERVRPFILAAVHPHAANPGAVRLLLRRRR